MATVPTPATWTAGEKPTATKFNTEIRDTEAFLLKPPSCSLTQTVVQSLPNGGPTIITMDVEEFDTDGMGDIANDRINITTTGLYFVMGQVGLAASTSNTRRFVTIFKNGADFGIRNEHPGGGSAWSTLSATGIMSLTAGDNIQVGCYQNTTAALNTSVSAPMNSRIQVSWIGKAA